MKIYVEADACPVVGIVEEAAKKYDIPATLLCDTNHVLNSQYSEVKIIGISFWINALLFQLRNTKHYYLIHPYVVV